MLGPLHSHFKDPVFATVVFIIKYKSLCFLLRMKKQSWKLCMPTVRLYAISQLRTVNNCNNNKPYGNFLLAVTLPKSLQRILPGAIHVCITGIKSLGCSISYQR